MKRKKYSNQLKTKVALAQGKRMKFSAPDKLCEIFIIPACYLSFSFDAGLT